MARKRHRDDTADVQAVLRLVLQRAVDAISTKLAVDLTALTFRVRPCTDHRPPLTAALQDTAMYSSDVPLRLYHSKLLDLVDMKAAASLLLGHVKVGMTTDKEGPATIVHVDQTDDSSRLVLCVRQVPPHAESVLDVVLPLEVLHEDDAIIVVVKPHDLPSVDGRDRDTSLHGILRSKYPNVRMVHRLDMETSGVMVAALTHPSAQHLNAQFRAKTVAKTYTAVVEGSVSADCVVTRPLAADPAHRVKQIVSDSAGKPCETHCRVAEHMENGDTRVQLIPVTGRTHQLRVHMQSLGHPIVGDSLYSARPVTPTRLCLHATTLEFVHPTTGAKMHFHSEPPF